MSEPINSVDFKRVHFPEGGPSNDSDFGSPHYSSPARGSAGATASNGQESNSLRDQAAGVQGRLQEAGANVRVGVETVQGNTIFTVRDAETGRIIRKIPSDEAIRISQNIDRLTGVYLDRLE